MAKTREDLHQILLAITPRVYFQPPDNLSMVYPCIRYERNYTETVFADDVPYRHTRRYLVTVIDKDPDSEIPDAVRQLPMCKHDRWFAADNLNHDVFNLFF